MIFAIKKMPNEDNKFLKYNLGEKSLKVPFIIYDDIECLLNPICTGGGIFDQISCHVPLGFQHFAHFIGGG